MQIRRIISGPVKKRRGGVTIAGKRISKGALLSAHSLVEREERRREGGDRSLKIVKNYAWLRSSSLPSRIPIQTVASATVGQLQGVKPIRGPLVRKW